MFQGTPAGFAEQTTPPRISHAEATTRRSKGCLSRMAKGGGLIFSLRRIQAHYEGMGT
jgi:hypothetical protein